MPQQSSVFITELGRAQHCIAQRNLRGGIRVYKDLLEQRPNDMRMQERLAALLREDGQTDAARLLYRMIARRWESEGFYLRAITNYRRLSELEPQDLNARRHLAELSEALHLKDAAVDLYRGLADIFAAQGNHQRRAAMFKRLVNLRPNDVDTRLQYAQELDATGEHGAANVQLAEALRFCAEHEMWQRYVSMAQRYLERVPSDTQVRSQLRVAVMALEQAAMPIPAPQDGAGERMRADGIFDTPTPVRTRRPDFLPNGDPVAIVSEMSNERGDQLSEDSMLRALASIDQDHTDAPAPPKGRMGPFYLRSFGPSAEVLLRASDHVVAAAIRARRRGDSSLALALLEDESARNRPLSATYERAMAYIDHEQWGEAMKLLTDLMDADLADGDRALVAYCLGVVAEMTHDLMLVRVCFEQTERLCPGEARDIPARLARLDA